MTGGVFVTGTDTHVGKTVVSAALLQRYRAQAPVRYWKPIQTGSPYDDDTATVRRLAASTADEVIDEGIRLEAPVSPHLAARLSGTTLSLSPIIATARSRPAFERLVVEGAGGVLVPINDVDRMVDLMAALGLPVLVVARTALGTINHTLLTLEALRHRALPIAGVVMVGTASPDNRTAIERYGHTPVLGSMPWFDPLNSRELDLWARTQLDPEGHLERLLR